MYEYIYERIDIPKGIMHNHRAPYVFVEFIVEKDGKISEVEVPYRNRNKRVEALLPEIILNMPNWEPAMHGGRPVRYKYMLGIKVRAE